MSEYRKKPVIIEAVQYTGYNDKEIFDFVPKKDLVTVAENEYGIKTLEGVMTISKGDYVIRGIQGEFYPCKPDIFEDSYEEVDTSERSV